MFPYDKEHIKNELKKVFHKWDYKLANGMDMYDEEKFLNDLINTMDKLCFPMTNTGSNMKCTKSKINPTMINEKKGITTS